MKRAESVSTREGTQREAEEEAEEEEEEEERIRGGGHGEDPTL